MLKVYGTHPPVKLSGLSVGLLIKRPRYRFQDDEILSIGNGIPLLIVFQ